MNDSAEIRTRIKGTLFFFWAHAFLLALALLLPKALKARAEYPHFFSLQTLIVLFTELALILSFEFLIFYAGHNLNFNKRRILWALWGLTLLPLLFISVIDLRFFLSTGSGLQWSLFIYALKNLRQLKPLLDAEAKFLWWFLLALTPVCACGFALWGYRLKDKTAAVSLRRKNFLFGLGMVLFLLLPWPLLLRLAMPGDTLNENLYVGFLKGAARDLLETDIQSHRQQFATQLVLQPLQLDAGAETKKFNIVIVAIESLRADATNLYGAPLDTTPFLQRLAHEGLLVEHGYTTMPHTTKSLIPIFCGIPPRISQALSETVVGGLPAPCLPELLQPLGYRSAFFQPANDSFENRRGLIRNMGFQDFFSHAQLTRPGFEKANYLGIEERALIEPIMQWVDQGPQPFVLGIMTLLSHHDYKVPKHFKKKKYAGSPEWSDFLNTVRYTDDFLDELFREFAKRHLDENTLFVFLGDHGEAFSEHGRKGHDSILYEEGVHVAWLMHNRKLIPQAQSIAGLRQNIDLLPTLIDLLHLQVVQGKIWGRSLLEPAEKIKDRVLYFSCWWKDACMARLQGQDKFIYYPNSSKAGFFNLQTDPAERSNLIRTLTGKQVQTARNELENWRQDIESFYNLSAWMKENPYSSKKRPAPSHKLKVKVGKQLEIIGYDAKEKANAREELKVTLYFRTLNPMGWYWKPEFSFVDASGTVWPLKPSSIIDKEAPLYSWGPETFFKVEFSGRLPAVGVKPGQGSLNLGFAQYKIKRSTMSGDGVDLQRQELALPLLFSDG